MCLYSGEPNYNTSTSSAASRLTEQRGRGIVGQGIMVIMVTTRVFQNRIKQYVILCLCELKYYLCKCQMLVNVNGFINGLYVDSQKMLSSLEDNQKSLLKQSLSESEQKFQFGGNVARPCQMSILTFSTNSICQPGLRNYRKNPCSPRLTDPEFLYFDILFWVTPYNII